MRVFVSKYMTDRRELYYDVEVRIQRLNHGDAVVEYSRKAQSSLRVEVFQNLQSPGSMEHSRTGNGFI